MNEILAISIPEIRVFKDGDDITILHKEPMASWDDANSLLTFTMPKDYLDDEIANAVNRACSGLDWEKDFDTVFNKQEYRKAVLNIPNFLMGE